MADSSRDELMNGMTADSSRNEFDEMSSRTAVVSSFFGQRTQAAFAVLERLGLRGRRILRLLPLGHSRRGKSEGRDREAH